MKMNLDLNGLTLTPRQQNAINKLIDTVELDIINDNLVNTCDSITYNADGSKTYTIIGKFDEFE
jgi:hypothetical protein